MINTAYPSVIDFRDSYSIEESVAKMLGWMHGPKRLETVTMDERGLIPEHLPYLYSLLYPLDDHLDELQERARLELLDATDAYALAKGTAEEHAAFLHLGEKDVAKDYWDDVVDTAHFYKSEIKKELAKNEFSALKIDQPTTDDTGDTHIKLESLDDWAKKYRVTIIDVPASMASFALESQHQDDDEYEKADDLGRLGSVMANNLYTTFAFLLEAFAKTAPHKFMGEDDTLNVSAIALRLKELAAEANKNRTLSGQSYESLKDRIEEAVRIKKSKLLK